MGQVTVGLLLDIGIVQKKRQQHSQDGWITVGDVAKRDEDGFIYIVDRKKDMVITGGVNVYPREIEELLFGHPAVSDVAVIGVPDDKWGERLRAFSFCQRRRKRLTADSVASLLRGQARQL